MHVALGYYWFPATTGYHLERALRELGHRVSYIGLPASGRPGYDHRQPVTQVIERLPQPVDAYLWIDAGGPYFPPGIEDLSIPTAAYLIDLHVGGWRTATAGFFDAVFYAQKDYGPAYQRAAGHHQVYWLPLAAASDLHRRLDLPTVYDVGFVGNLTRAHRGSPREQRLRRLAERYHTNDFFRFYPPETVAEVYSQARIVVNISLAGDVNMRVFEGTACGALVVTDAAGNGLGDLYDVGRELVTYTDEADLFDRIDYYLAHEGERTRMASAGQARTLANHTYRHRASQVLEALNAPGFRRLAAMRQREQGARWRARRRIYTHLHMLEALIAGSRAASRNPLRRAWEVLPCLLRMLRG
jgi:hypothetical protein